MYVCVCVLCVRVCIICRILSRHVNFESIHRTKQLYVNRYVCIYTIGMGVDLDMDRYIHT